MVTDKIRKQVIKNCGYQGDNTPDWEIESLYKDPVVGRAFFFVLVILVGAAVILGWLVIFGLR